MNATPLEQLLLLEQSGELSAQQRLRLDAELAASAEARRLRAELRGLAAAVPPPPAGPVAAVARIDARLRRTTAPVAAFRPAWKSALAAAAALALLFGVRAFRSPEPAVPEDSVLAAAEAAEEAVWTDPLDEEFTELENLLFAISSDDSSEITEL